MNIAVIFAGGVGRRMHSGDMPKQFLEIENKAIIIHTLENFEYHPEIDGIVVACVEKWIPYLEERIREAGLKKVMRIVPGGTTGQDSIYAGLCAAKEAAGEEDGSIVLIHDGVRPLIDAPTISACLESVRLHGSAVTTAPLVETVIYAAENGIVRDVVDREQCLVARAPQCFYLRDILETHEKARANGDHAYIDSVTMMRQYGYELAVVPGPADNIKITTPKDYYTFKGLYEARMKEKQE